MTFYVVNFLSLCLGFLIDILSDINARDSKTLRVYHVLKTLNSENIDIPATSRKSVKFIDSKQYLHYIEHTTTVTIYDTILSSKHCVD